MFMFRDVIGLLVLFAGAGLSTYRFSVGRQCEGLRTSTICAMGIARIGSGKAAL